MQLTHQTLTTDGHDTS